MRLILILLLGLSHPANSELRTVEDFNSSLKILKDNSFVPFHGQPTNVVHLSMNIKEKNGFIQFHSARKFYLFINSSLVAQGNFFRLNSDSLSKIYQSHLFISVYQKNRIDDLSAKLVQRVPINEFENQLRQNNSFSNFILISSLILIAFFTALLRTNPQLTLDYLNAAKLISLRNRDESQITLRITSSVNFLFYSFAGLFTSCALLVASHFSSQGLSILADPTRTTVAQYFVLWVLLAIGVVALLMIKLFLARIAAVLFGWKDIAGFQFFHFVRALLLTLFIIGLMSIISFSLGINANYYFFIKLSCIMLSVATALLYFKLLAKAQFSSFHLFSYLCATEFIPLIVLIKVFLN